jgi:ferric-dicitrate binding protein FerR (iron transport regulator)
MQTVYTPAGQRAEIILSDGTKVWLNAMTSFSFPSQFTGEERRIRLNGEAYFDVREDHSRQFVVCSGDYQIRVLGTEFNVKAYRQNNVFETALVEGSLEVKSSRTKEKVTLFPGSYVYDNEGLLSIGKITYNDQFLWKEGIFAFEGATVREIFNKLELYFDVIIEVEKSEILDFYYTGKFRMKDGVEHALHVLQLRHKFSYTIDYETNKILIR